MKELEVITGTKATCMGAPDGCYLVGEWSRPDPPVWAVPRFMIKAAIQRGQLFTMLPAEPEVVPILLSDAVADEWARFYALPTDDQGRVILRVF